MKKLIIIITGLISLGFAAIVVAVLFLVNLDLNNYKDWISERFNAQTGRELSINGNIEFTLYPWLGLQVEDVSIGNPAGFSENSFLSSDFAAFRIRLMPLLDQSYEIDTIELRGTTLNLEVNAAGKNNWSFAAEDGDEEQPVAKEGDNEDFPFNQLIIGGVAIRDVTVSYSNQLDGRSMTAENINLDIPQLVYGEPLDIAMTMNLRSTSPDLESEINLSSTLIYDLDSNDYALQNLSLDFLDSSLIADLSSNDGELSGSLTFNTQRSAEIFALAGQAELADLIDSISLSVDLEGIDSRVLIDPLVLTLELSGPALNAPSTVELSAIAELDLERDSLSFDRLSLNGLGLQSEASLEVQSLRSQPALGGELSIARFSPRELTALLRIELPPVSDPNVLGSLAFSSEFSAGSDAFSLNEMTLNLDDSVISGSLEANSFRDADYAFNLAVDSLDMDRYLASESETRNSSASPPESAELPVEPLRNFSLDGAITIGELSVHGMNLSQVQVAVSADRGLITLDPVRASLYSGTYAGSLSLDTRGTVPSFSMQSGLQSIDLEPLSLDFMDASYLSGNADISLALSGSGSTSRAILENLNGNATLAVADGIFYGVDVGAVLGQLETMLRSRRMLNINRGEQTAFNNLSADIDLDNGIARSDNLMIQAPGFSISGTGVLANLQNDSIDFDLLASVDEASATVESEQFDIGGYALPIACNGNMNSPRCLPDIEGIVGNALGNVIEGEVGDLLQRIFGEGNQNQESNTSNEQTDQENDDPAEELLNRALDSLFR